MKILKRPYKILTYSEFLIEKYKDSQNMLKHARFDESEGTFGYFYIDKKTDELIGYIAFEGDTIIALEVVDKFQGLGYAKKMLELANSRGATKLTVNKSNENAIQMYKHLGYKVYKKTNKMLFMKLKIRKE